MSGEVTKYPEWRQAVEDFVAMNPSPGYMITKAWMLERFCIQFPELGSRKQMRDLELKFLKYRTKMEKELMRNYGYQLSKFDDQVQAYRVLHPKEVATVVRRESDAELRRSLTKSTERLAFTNLGELTSEELAAHAELQVRITRKLQAFNEVDRTPVLPVAPPVAPPRVCVEQSAVTQ